MTSTPNTETAPVVPEARLLVSGNSFGGAYWDEAEYEVILETVAHTGKPDDVVALVSLNNSGGGLLERTPLTRAQADAILALASRVDEDDLVPGIPRIKNTLIWSLGNTISDYVEIKDFDEIYAWLKYALGIDTWDYDEDGDEWEY